MNESYGFNRAKKAGSETVLDSIPKGPVQVDRQLESQAIANAERDGYISREVDAAPVLPSGRRKKAVPSKSIFVRGPSSKIDRFVAFTDAHGFTSYSAAIEHLLSHYERAGG